MSLSSTKKFSGIFVSYRREDSAGHAGRLFDKLVQHFGRERIFMDIDTIEPGEDFVTVIENAVGSCDILIAVICRNWNSASSSGRLDNPNDFVRLEIATALRRDIRVIPVLVQRANMPKPEDLPDDLDKLTRRNAIELSDLRWQTDVEQLISIMERVLAEKEAQEVPGAAASVFGSVFADRKNRRDGPPPNKYKRLMLIAGASLMVLLTATIIIRQFQGAPRLPVNTNQAATPQPSLLQQSTVAQPTQTPESKPSPSPASETFAEPTYWERDDTKTVLRIVRRGQTVRAVVHKASETASIAGRIKGDLAFKGFFENGTIKGKAYILFPPAHVSRCPAFGGEQPLDLELTLSADGNKLSGSREDYEISENCKIINRPRIQLRYTKTSP